VRNDASGSEHFHVVKSRAFTLVELLIVIIIVAVLAAVAIPKFANSSNRAKEANLRQQLKNTRAAVDRFYADTGAFPLTLGHLGMTSATFDALSSNGISGGAAMRVPGGRFQGPYMSSQGGTVTLTPTTGLGGATSTALSCPRDPITGGTFSYTVTGTRATIGSTASGNDSSGRAWSTY
jgi:prepilin-type N-terminal cleavage/methylation domain-containing protein